MDRRALAATAALALASPLIASGRADAVESFAVSDYPSTQAAIDAASAAGGGLVRFPCGTTTLQSGLVIKKPRIG